MLNRPAINQNGSFRRFPKASDESGERCFAAPRWPDDGESRAGRDFEVDVGKNGVRATAIGAGAIGTVNAGKRGWVDEGQIAKLDFALRCGIFREDCRAIVDTGFRRQNEIQAAHGSGATLKNIGHPTERNHGPYELVQIEKEGNQRAKRDLAAKKLVAALPKDN